MAFLNNGYSMAYQAKMLALRGNSDGVSAPNPDTIEYRCHLCDFGGQGGFVREKMIDLQQLPEDIRSFKFPADEIRDGHHGGFDVCRKCADPGNGVLQRVLTAACPCICGPPPPLEVRLRKIMQDRTDPNSWHNHRKREMDNYIEARTQDLMRRNDGKGPDYETTKRLVMEQVAVTRATNGHATF